MATAVALYVPDGDRHEVIRGVAYRHGDMRLMARAHYIARRLKPLERKTWRERARRSIEKKSW